jgi:hypothetical protein
MAVTGVWDRPNTGTGVISTCSDDEGVDLVRCNGEGLPPPECNENP